MLTVGSALELEPVQEEAQKKMGSAPATVSAQNLVLSIFTMRAETLFGTKADTN